VTERVVPPIQSDPAPVIAELLRGTIARSELVDHGLTNTLWRVELTDGRIIGVKQYVLGRSYATEGAALREVAGAIPVPEIVCTLDRVIAYRWIDGVTLDDVRQQGRSVRGLAAPLGQLLGALAGIRREASPVDLAPALLQLERGRARSRLGGQLSDALRGLLEPRRFDDPTCFVHGDFGGRNVIVAPSLDRIAGVIGWETATAGSMLLDVGSLLRHANRYDADFRAELERAHGSLPADWYRRSRLLDATRLVATLGEDRERPEIHDELRDLVASAVASAS
jgi:aminoglycoside phosphotransferase (APT) family kinase protein